MDRSGSYRLLSNYRTYSIASFALWVAILTGVAVAAPSYKLHTFLLIFGGWALGWTSATVARSVYPSPHRATAPPPAP